MKFLARQREPVDVSLGGVRIYSDEAMRVGDLLKMEFFVQDVEPVTYTAEVVWIDPLPAGRPGQVRRRAEVHPARARGVAAAPQGPRAPRGVNAG
jgi:hypothetical protein